MKSKPSTNRSSGRLIERADPVIKRAFSASRRMRASLISRAVEIEIAAEMASLREGRLAAEVLNVSRGLSPPSTGKPERF